MVQVIFKICDNTVFDILSICVALCQSFCHSWSHRYDYYQLGYFSISYPISSTGFALTIVSFSHWISAVVVHLCHFFHAILSREKFFQSWGQRQFCISSLLEYDLCCYNKLLSLIYIFLIYIGESECVCLSTQNREPYFWLVLLSSLWILT